MGLAEFWYPAQVVAYSGTACMAAPWYQMGNTPTIGNLSFEVFGNMNGSGANGIDADPAAVIFDFLTHPRYGAGFDPGSIDEATLFGASGAQPADLLQVARHLLLAIDLQPGGGVLDPQPLAANLQLHRGVERRPTEVHSLRRQRDRRGRPVDRQPQLLHPLRRPARQRHDLLSAGAIHVASPDEFVSDGGVVYADNGFPLLTSASSRHLRRPSICPPASTAMNPPGTYWF